MYLFKPSERSQSEPCEFYFYPNTEDIISSMPPLILNEIPKEEAEKCGLLMHTQPRDENGTDLPVVATTLAPDYKVYFSDRKSFCRDRK